MFVETRKVIKMAESLAITLPPIWLKKNCIKKGDFLEVLIKEDSLRIKPKKDKQ